MQCILYTLAVYLECYEYINAEYVNNSHCPILLSQQDRSCLCMPMLQYVYVCVTYSMFMYVYHTVCLCMCMIQYVLHVCVVCLHV